MNLTGSIIFSVGFFFVLTGTVGVLRLPDFYSRLHAVGKSDTLGVSLMLGGIALTQGFSLTSIKLLAILLFIALANPTATHALGRAAWKAGVTPWTKSDTNKS